MQTVDSKKKETNFCHILGFHKKKINWFHNFFYIYINNNSICRRTDVVKFANHPFSLSQMCFPNKLSLFIGGGGDIWLFIFTQPVIAQIACLMDARAFKSLENRAERNLSFILSNSNS